MIDVHPPHAPTHTWRDFFIHIATIVVGLLIAIGLEQTVEWIHHRHEVRETREALKQEREQARRIHAVNVAYFRRDRAMLMNDLRILEYLQQHPGTSEEKLPGVPLWLSYFDYFDASTYNNARQTQVLSLLPREEAEADGQFYEHVAKMNAAASEAASASIRAGSYAATDPDISHENPSQLAVSLKLTQEALYMNLMWGVELTVTGFYNEDFGGRITQSELEHTAGWARSPEDMRKVANAFAITQMSLQAADAAVKAANQAKGSGTPR